MACKIGVQDSASNDFSVRIQNYHQDVESEGINQWILCQETVTTSIKTQREGSDDYIAYVPDHPIPLAQSNHTDSKSCGKKHHC